ncbi:hypothetical protein [Shimia sagamensis]|uniref:Transposase n=1 Tax=Shimia sagamensis TaxID=1566352 RepID=A0ABY1P022_9RHOB|nr:hypothetical protein [Shimia sagamensis]SMP22285.1 hypothetical protein SAMN06265373_104150 [Shimia sagamensis]
MTNTDISVDFPFANRNRDKINGIVFMEAMHGEIDRPALSRSDKTLMKLIRSPFASWLMLDVMNSFVKQMLPDWIVRDLNRSEMAAILRHFPLKKAANLFTYVHVTNQWKASLKTSHVLLRAMLNGSQKATFPSCSSMPIPVC